MTTVFITRKTWPANNSDICYCTSFYKGKLVLKMQLLHASASTITKSYLHLLLLLPAATCDGFQLRQLLPAPTTTWPTCTICDLSCYSPPMPISAYISCSFSCYFCQQLPQHMLQPVSAAICPSCCQHQIESITIPAEGGTLGHVENVENENPGHDSLVEELCQGMVHPVGGAAEPGPRRPDPGQHQAVVQAQEQGKRPGLPMERGEKRHHYVKYMPFLNKKRHVRKEKQCQLSRHGRRTVKKVMDFPVPSRDVTNQTLPGRE